MFIFMVLVNMIINKFDSLFFWKKQKLCTLCMCSSSMKSNYNYTLSDLHILLVLSSIIIIICLFLLNRELSRFISAGRLNCKIDKVGGVVETNRCCSY